MVNKFSKILIKILVIAILFTTLITVLSKNDSYAQSYKTGRFYSFYRLRGDPRLYCIERGYEFEPGTFYCYATNNNISAQLSYAVYHQKYGDLDKGGNGTIRDKNYDPVANIVWYYTGNNVSVTPEYKGLLEECNVAASLKSKGNVSIIAPSSPIIENEEGKYGPFIINYPYANGKLIGDSLTVKINGTVLSTIPESGEEFYLDETQINYGAENIIEIYYNGKLYSGTSATFTPGRTETKYETCNNEECGAKRISTRTVYLVNGRIAYAESWYISSEDDHIEDCTGDFVETYSYYGENTQDVIRIEPTTTPIEDSDEEKFWIGKPDIEIDFEKINTEGENIKGAKFNIAVDGGTVDGETIIITGTEGNKILIKPNKGATKITVTLTEIEAPEEYALLESPIVIEYKWDSEAKEWVNITQNFEFISGEDVTITKEIGIRSTANCIDKFSITAENRRKIIINLLKTDNASIPNALANMTFDIGVKGGTCEISTITTDANGKADFMIIPDGTGDVTLVLKEKSNKYYMDMEPIVITFVYRDGKWQPHIDASISEQVSINGEIAIFDLVIKNKAKIEDLILTKINKSLSGETIPGVTFRINFENAKTLKGSQFMTAVTDSNGNINLGILEVIDPNNPISITFQEIAVPNDGLNYQGLYPYSTVTITFKHKQSGCTVDNNLVVANYDVTNNIVSVEVSNTVTMDVSGQVWLDAQTGIKPVTSPNGLKDSGEQGVEGVIVKLIRDNGAVINTCVTDNSGKYEFKNIPASVKGTLNYYITFTYDGINYIATQSGLDSDATEIDRSGFNDRFATITKDVAMGVAGSTTPLEYTYSDNGATLITMENGVVKEKFAMVATTMPTTYNKNTENIDLGLVKKGVDLAVVTDIHSATVTINGEVSNYEYTDIKKLEKDENGNLILEKTETNISEYNLSIYNSDYSYRIGDYKLPATRSDILNVNTYNASSNLLNERVNDGDLNIEVTYQILLNNQSATEATINQIAYYYDTRYVLDGVTPELVNINGQTYNKIILDVNKKFTDSDNQGVAELVFTVGKDSSGNIYTGTLKNWVEIISYSTNESCIDIDSAPDNIEIHSPEDDTDDSNGLNLYLNNLVRTISGYVFEDEKSDYAGQYNTGNGIYDSNEAKIDDVIVQLIEIKDVTVGDTTLKLEYIWQETVSGSNTVRYVTSDGLSSGEYNVTNEPGHYTFNQNIIPGNYIVRFIYGDGTYYDAESASNLTKYNGQDYKSTSDIYYNKTWYVSSYPENSSMARDNEARRLEEMAYATNTTIETINNLTIDSKEKLDNTWMYADTSTIWMQITENEGINDVKAISKGINFGLVERPRAYLVLEKHITEVKIDGITTATTSLENYDNASENGLKVELNSNNGESIFATATSKEENARGEWLIQTKTDEIGGKRLDIKYSYRILNIGDIDYIGEETKNKLSEGKSYSEIAKEVKSLTLNSNYVPGKYLGTAYYTGNKTTDIISTIPFQVEDYINTEKGLELDTTCDFIVTNENSSQNIWDYVETKSDEKSATDSAVENVSVIQSKNILTLYTNQQTFSDNPITLKIYDESLDSTSTRQEFSYRSYAAQLIYPTTGTITSQTGTLCDGRITLSNLNTVQSYVDDLNAVSINDITPELDEFIAETVTITMDTGENKETPIVLIISITSGLAIIAIGIVLIKKFVIK